MFTVKELIEALQQCPADYEVRIEVLYQLDSVGIDHEEKAVSLFKGICEEWEEEE